MGEHNKLWFENSRPPGREATAAADSPLSTGRFSQKRPAGACRRREMPPSPGRVFHHYHFNRYPAPGQAQVSGRGPLSSCPSPYAKEKAPIPRGFSVESGYRYFLAGIGSIEVTVIIFLSLYMVPLTVTSVAAILSIMASSPESTNVDLSAVL